MSIGIEVAPSETRWRFCVLNIGYGYYCFTQMAVNAASFEHSEP